MKNYLWYQQKHTMGHMRDLILTCQGVVYPWHCDHMGHMNVMWYAGKFDEATWQLFSMMGMTPTYMRENQRGMVAVQQNTTYKQELLAGSLIAIRSGVLQIQDKVIHFCHEMRNAETDTIAAVTSLIGVHIDTQIRKSCPFPDDFVARANTFLVEYAL